jgi:hypothetical protein
MEVLPIRYTPIQTKLLGIPKYMPGGFIVRPQVRWQKTWGVWEPVFSVEKEDQLILFRHVAGGAELPPIVKDAGKHPYTALMLADLAAQHYVDTNNHQGGVFVPA